MWYLLFIDIVLSNIEPCGGGSRMALSLCLVLQFQEYKENYRCDSGVRCYVLQSCLYAPDRKEHDNLPCD